MGILRQILQTFCILLPVILLTAQSSSLKNNAEIFHNPIFEESWPDPYCYKHTDGYYYMPRREDDRRGIGLFRTKTLSNWRNAEKAVVVRAPDGLMSLWAPEIHFINGNFYLYYAMDDGNNANHRMYVSRALNPNNPMGEWTASKRMVPPGDDFWAIDATVLQYGTGQLYLIWSGWPTLNAGFPQNIYIARLCDPETICSQRVLLAEPIFSWEQHGEPLLEGPQILHNAGRVFLIYSASGSWTADYTLGFMGIDNLADPLNPGNWWRHNQPVFWRNDEQKVFGVGHASFTKSPDGTENYIMYHAMEDPAMGWDNRTARIEKFGWNPDNSPAFPRPAGFDVAIPVPSGEQKLSAFMLRYLFKRVPISLNLSGSNSNSFCKAGSAGVATCRLQGREQEFSSFSYNYRNKSGILTTSKPEVTFANNLNKISKQTMATLSADVKAKLDKVADVKIDEKGKFKYILIKVYATDSTGKHVDENSKLVVRGRGDCPFHGDIFDKFQEETAQLEGIDDEILGGGRIQRDGNKILVFGYSQGYGRADHTLTVELIKKSYPTHEITWSNDGY
ncbi:Extracellular exo-alpha-(1-_5)-L-arabinofuranosidase [Orchesella cincta]|uniref:Extracellular exo-alpha-(1->5)-L-arabinofuranosidase n=1 Tax=Orchesella cincta TaxID=48709 RepID=A0A1D2MSZ4_ORCCI|nr:Extracellular exo-alpha-(1->5)-L-arabinofuranosidase [Orchesella cincta]